MQVNMLEVSGEDERETESGKDRVDKQGKVKVEQQK